MSKKVYPQYKPSGVTWLGKIPEHWETRRAIYCCNLNMGQSPISEECNVDGDGLPFLQGCAEFGAFSPEPAQYCDTVRKVAAKGDILISVRAPVGALNIADRDYGIGRGLCAVRPRQDFIEATFCWYLLHEMREQLNIQATGSTYKAVSAEDVGNIQFIIPPLEEQRAIAAFLDRETARIDALIEKKQKQIELLQEKRTTLISQVVTKGLTQDVKMKDSGIEWLGEIPEHWRINKAKVLFKEINERSTSGEEELLTVSHITGVTRRSEKNVTMFLAESLEGYKRCESRDLVINTMWAWMGAMGIAFEPGIVSPSYNVYRFRTSDYEPLFYDYLFRTGRFVSEVIRHSKGVWTSRLRLYPEEFFEIRLPCPPLHEQHNIVDAIERETGEYMVLQHRIEQSIDKLREYRTALISAAVTGKIDVRKETA